MYFPYFRGRQYELLALKELVNGQLLSKSVVPVVEPVRLVKKDGKAVIPYKMIPSFNVAIQAFIDAKSQIAIIGNPTVGDFARDVNFVDTYYAQHGIVTNVIPALLMRKNTDRVLQTFIENGVAPTDIIAILDKRDFLDTYNRNFVEVPPLYTMFPDERQIRRTVTQGKVMFEDKFIKQEKNSDYEAAPDEFFSEDHLYYSDEGYVGFGDYSVVGSIYEEGGFAPKAVAIHIVYFDVNNILRIRHFVSDSNMDIKDVAGKYYEAVTKLFNWYHEGQQSQQTDALLKFISHYENGYYPGLPTIKKLSIMHHLELMSKYLDGGMAK